MYLRRSVFCTLIEIPVLGVHRSGFCTLIAVWGPENIRQNHAFGHHPLRTPEKHVFVAEVCPDVVLVPLGKACRSPYRQLTGHLAGSLTGALRGLRTSGHKSLVAPVHEKWRNQTIIIFRCSQLFGDFGIFD